MSYDKIRLKVNSLLLGKKHIGRFAVLFPRFIKALQFVLWALMIAHTADFDVGESGVVLSVAFATASILLQFIAVSFELLRDRWLCSTLGRDKKSFSELFVGFSLADLLLAVKLSFIFRLRCVLRIILFMSFPLTVSIYCFELSGFEMSRAKWAVCVCGCLLLIAVGAFFAALSVCPLLAAKRMSCFDLKNPFSAFYKKTMLLDRSCLSLLRFNFTFHPFRSAGKAMAAIIFAKAAIRQHTSGRIIY